MSAFCAFRTFIKDDPSFLYGGKSTFAVLFERHYSIA